MKIFSDRHHSGLYNSLHMTLENRLGHELFCPIGLEWATEKYWLIHKPYNFNLDTARQFLDAEPFVPKDGTPVLNNVEKINQDYYVIDEAVHGFKIKAITLEQFKRLEIDIIIASIPDHFESFRALRDKYKPNAKLVCQVGNIFWHETLGNYKIDNLMASVAPFKTNIPNTIFYNQEMKVVPYKEPPTRLAIRSFVNLLPQPAIYNKYKDILSSRALIEAYGAGTPQGMISGIDKLYYKMQDTSMIFHHKPMGDGWGHIIHSAFMLGRPVITNFMDYKGKLAEKLLIDNVTAIDMGKRPFSQNIALLSQILGDRERLNTMCTSAFNIFKDNVDYQKDAHKIAEFLERLI